MHFRKTAQRLRKIPARRDKHKHGGGAFRLAFRGRPGCCEILCRPRCCLGRTDTKSRSGCGERGNRTQACETSTFAMEKLARRAGSRSIESEDQGCPATGAKMLYETLSVEKL